MHSLVANPELQAQVVDYAKQACSVFPSFQATCEADVDQYAPMVFGMALAYLQPEQVREIRDRTGRQIQDRTGHDRTGRCCLGEAVCRRQSIGGVQHLEGVLLCVVATVSTNTNNIGTVVSCCCWPLQVCVQLRMCPPPSIFSVLNQALGLQTNLLGTKFASFSVITTHTPTTMPTGIATISSSSSSSTVIRDSDSTVVAGSSSDEGVEEELLEDTADSGSVVLSSPHDAKQVKARAKVHGPGLALPMAS